MCDKPYTSSDKWTAAFISGLLFMIVSSPYVYNATNNISTRLGFGIANNCGMPNLLGLLIHGLVFTLLLRAMMNKSNNGCLKPYTSRDKWIVSIMGGLLFLLISSPFLYEAVNSITSSFGLNTTDINGCPSLSGLMVHSSVFVLVTRLLMR